MGSVYSTAAPKAEEDDAGHETAMTVVRVDSFSSLPSTTTGGGGASPSAAGRPPRKKPSSATTTAAHRRRSSGDSATQASSAAQSCDVAYALNGEHGIPGLDSKPIFPADPRDHRRGTWRADCAPEDLRFRVAAWTPPSILFPAIHAEEKRREAERKLAEEASREAGAGTPPPEGTWSAPRGVNGGLSPPGQMFSGDESLRSASSSGNAPELGPAHSGGFYTFSAV